jgi:hypothetical protein
MSKPAPVYGMDKAIKNKIDSKVGPETIEEGVHSEFLSDESNQCNSTHISS